MVLGELVCTLQPEIRKKIKMETNNDKWW